MICMFRLLLADVFENFRNKCIEIYELDPADFLSPPGLAWQSGLKKAGVKLELLTGIDMLLMVEKEIRGGMCKSIHRYAKANNRYVKNHRDIKLVTTGKRRNQLASEPNYHTSEYFSENLMAIEIKKTKVKMNKPIYLGM